MLIKDYSQAVKYLEASLKNSENLSGTPAYDVFFRVNLAYAYRQLGEETKLQSAVAKLKTFIEKAHQQGWNSNELIYQEARLSMLEGQPEVALTTLQKSVTQGYSVYWWITTDPLMDTLKTNPAFEEFVIQLRTRVQQSVANAKQTNRY